MEQERFKKFINEFSDNLKLIFDRFTYFGFEIRIVGGAVRDLLSGITPRDIDLATNAMPTEILYILQNEIKQEEIIISKGIRHGTIVVAFSLNEQYEITSLDFSMKTVKNKIIMTSNTDWKSDAKRRDFTINAMSIDQDGKLYDYLGGQEDLKNQEIKFIGNYKEKIKDDPIMILRFLKLIGKFEHPIYDEKVIDYIKENINELEQLKPETIKWFIGNILEQPHKNQVVPIMKEIGLVVDNYTESHLSRYLKKI